MPAVPAVAVDSSRRRESGIHDHRVQAALLIVLTVLAYAPAIQCGFVWDDDDYVTENETLRTAQGFTDIWTSPRAIPQYYPLVHTTYWLELHVWGLEPAGYHATNIVLQALGVLILWRLLAFLEVPGELLAAALFAVHPLQVESVVWITERKNVLCGVFYWAAALVFLRAALTPTRSSGRWEYAAALVLFLCALLSKTIAGTLPLGLLLVLWWKRDGLARRDFLALLPWFVLGLGFGLFTLYLERNYVGASGDDWHLSLVARLLLAGRILWFYLLKLIWPFPLIFVYPRWTIDASVIWQWSFSVLWLVLLGLLWIARRWWGRGAFVALAFYTLALAPALGFFNVFPMQFSYVADHFAYLAIAGPLAAAASALVSLARRFDRAVPLVIAISVALVVASASITCWRTRAFSTPEALWLDTVAQNPGAWIAHQNLGVIALKQGDLEVAEKRFKRTLELNPREVRTYNNLGTLKLLQGDPQKALRYFQRALELEPRFVAANLNAVRACLALNRFADARENYLAALRVDPRVAGSEEQLALKLLHKSDPAAAALFVQEATQTVSHWPALTNELAWLLATDPSSNRAQQLQAHRLATAAVESSGRQDANNLDTLAAAEARLGHFSAAVATATEALQLRAAMAKNRSPGRSSIA